MDFGPGSDRIDLSPINVIAGGATGDAFTFLGAGTAFSDACGEVRVVEGGGVWFAEADVNGDRFADLAIRIDNGAACIFAAGDFVL